MNFHIPKEQVDAIMAKYADDEGFFYWRFLKDVAPPSKTKLSYEYPKRIEKLREAFNKDKRQLEAEPVIRDAEGVMDYIKREVYHQRIRLAEWFRDYDPLKHGEISRQRFRRALSLVPIPLKETELNVIEH